MKEELEKENLKLRYLLWASHPCKGKYGDDGEMQCGQCGIDFRRNSPYDIEKRIYDINMKKLMNERGLTG